MTSSESNVGPAKRLPVLTIIAVTLLSVEMWVLAFAFAAGFVAMVEWPA